MPAPDAATIRIFTSLGISSPQFLGSGIGSHVYDCGDGTAIKIHGGAEVSELEALKAFYIRLGEYQFPFAVPRIHQIGFVDGTVYTIERRLPGKTLSSVLPGLRGQPRRDLLERYLAAVEPLRQVALPGDRFGHVLGREQLHAPTWRGFVERMAEEGLARGAAYLHEGLGSVRPIEEFFAQNLQLVEDPPGRSLVHGDYWPDNVLVDHVDGRLDVSAVLDFNGMTLAGDHRLDIAASAIFLEMRRRYPRRDAQFALRQAIARHGPQIESVVRFYRLWYATIYAHTKPFDPLTYGWCLDSFRRELSFPT